MQICTPNAYFRLCGSIKQWCRTYSCCLVIARAAPIEECGLCYYCPCLAIYIIITNFPSLELYLYDKSTMRCISTYKYCFLTDLIHTHSIAAVQVQYSAQLHQLQICKILLVVLCSVFYLRHKSPGSIWHVCFVLCLVHMLHYYYLASFVHV